MLLSVFLTQATQAVIIIMAQPEIICGENLSCNLSGTTEIRLKIFHIFPSHLNIFNFQTYLTGTFRFMLHRHKGNLSVVYTVNC